MLLTASTHGQDNLFVVYSTKGNVAVIEQQRESKARIGTMLKGNSQLKIGSGSFATLICNETRIFTLARPGSYTLNNLKDSCTVTAHSSVSANYLKYIWNELTKSKGSPESNRKAYMSNVGAVSRTINNVWIDPKLDTLNYVSGQIPLSWKAYTDATAFEFRIFASENDEKPLLIKQTTKKHVPITELLKTIKPGNSYWWTAMVKGENNEERKLLHYWPKDKYKEFYEQQLQAAASENEAEANFRMGFLLEEAHFLAEAYQHYLKATQLAPTVILYRSTFMSFKKDYEFK